MIHSLFLFSIIGLAVSSFTGVTSMDGTSVLSILRSDPSALLRMFDDGPYNNPDKTKLNMVIGLIKNLREAGRAEIVSLNQEEAASLQNVEDKRSLYDNATGAHAAAVRAWNDARNKESRAYGRLTAAIKQYDAESGALIKEIDVYERVIDLMGQLLSGKNLLEADIPELRAFISLGDQADPIKVQRVINLLQKLLKISQEELQGLKDDVANAQGVYDDAVEARITRAGQVASAAEIKRLAREAWEQAVGEHNVLKDLVAKRIAVINKEDDLLASVIALIQKMELV